MGHNWEYKKGNKCVWCNKIIKVGLFSDRWTYCFSCDIPVKLDVNCKKTQCNKKSKLVEVDIWIDNMKTTSLFCQKHIIGCLEHITKKYDFEVGVFFENLNQKLQKKVEKILMDKVEEWQDKEDKYHLKERAKVVQNNDSNRVN